MIGARIGGTLLPTYQRRLVALWRDMKTNLTSIGTAAVAATMLLAGLRSGRRQAGAAQEHAPSLDAAGAKVSRYAARTVRSAPTTTRPRRSSSSSPRRARRSTRAKSAPAAAAIRTRAISRSTVDTLQARIAKRDWSPSAKKYNYASWLDLKTGKLVLKTNAPRSVTAPLSKGYAGVIEQRDEVVRDSFEPPRRRPLVLGRQLDQERRRRLHLRLPGAEERPALPHHRGPLLRARRRT